jgi:hypothetical protein
LSHKSLKSREDINKKVTLIFLSLQAWVRGDHQYAPMLDQRYSL